MTDQLPIPEITDNGLVPCVRCRKTFMSKKWTCTAGIITTTLTSSVCNPCAEAQDAAIKLERIRHQESQIAAHEATREQQWVKLCPVEFRLEGNEGGHTQLAKLELNARKLPELMAYKYNSRGLIIRGETGRCKTRGAWRLMRRLWLESKTIIALTAKQFDLQCRDAGGTHTLTAWVERLENADVFFLDDFGKGQWTEHTESVFFEVIDSRNRNGLPVFVTTNEDGVKIKAHLTESRGEPLVRRLRDYCDTINF